MPTLTFRGTFLKLQTMVVILIQLDRSLFSHSQLILCVTATRHGWFCLLLPTLQRLHLPAYGPGPHLSPPELPSSAQSTDPFQPPGLPPGISQHGPCLCPSPWSWGCRCAIPIPAAGGGLGWDRRSDPARLLLPMAHRASQMCS